MWAGEATPLLGPEGPLPARGRDDPVSVVLLLRFFQILFQGFKETRILFLSVHVVTP